MEYGLRIDVIVSLWCLADGERIEHEHPETGKKTESWTGAIELDFCVCVLC